jgi:hypothetical protein
MSLSRYDFRQTHTVLKGVHEMLSVFSTFLSDLDKICYWADARNNLLIYCEVRENRRS